MSNENYMLIDNIPVAIEGEKNMLELIRKAGIDLPTFCYNSELSIYGACRMCMVENKWGGMEAACSTPPKAGAEIFTNTPKLRKHRKMILELLLSNHCRDCTICAKNGNCRLQELALRFGITKVRFENTAAEPDIDDSSLCIVRDRSKCILCGDCVRMCNEVQNVGAINFTNRGSKMVVSTVFDEPLVKSSCVGCGQCAAVCPTGALVEKRKKNYRPWEVTRVRTTCPHCATGCQMDLIVKDGKIVDCEGADGPSNHGLLCVKGRSGSFDFVDCDERIRYPLIKNKETGEFERATWDEALDLVASKFTEIRDNFGGEALAGFACSRSCNEDIYMLQKMVRAAFKSNNTDNCARV